MQHGGRWRLVVLGCWLAFVLVACAGEDEDAGEADDDAADDDLDDDAGDDDTGGGGYTDPWDIWMHPWPQDPYADLPDFDESPEPGPLRQKVMAYDAWHEAWHQPFYGATLNVHFADEERTRPDGYGGRGDSCIWTGTYLASQAFRYAVTKDPQAKANAIRSARALDGNLHVTGRPGFIARYHGPQDPLIFGSGCGDDENCHVVDSGPYAGDFWIGNTSRDQYTGWFFGMSLAYDLVDDEDLRAMIRADVEEVLDELMRQKWMITDVDGRATTAGPGVRWDKQIAWPLIGYHMTGKGKFKRVVQHWLQDRNRSLMRAGHFNFFNRYAQYYANNLAHQNYYSLLRLARVYLNANDYGWYRDLFESKVHSYTRLSHNAFFTAIHMSQGIWAPAGDDPYLAQMLEDLADFRPAPNYVYATTPPPAEVDPVSVYLADLWDRVPFFEELLGDINPQALHAFPVPYQCATDFLWQRNPFRLACGNAEDPRSVNPGVDYLVAYWMAAFHGFLTKDQ